MIKTLFKSMKLCVLAVLFFTGCSGGSSSSGPSSSALSSALPFVANGPVYAIAVSNDGTTYIGGAFTQVGRATGGFVPIDAATGQPLSSFPKVNGTVNVLAPDGSGGQYIGGSFTHVGGVNRNNIAHILSDGTVDPSWNPDSNGSSGVAALVVSGNTVYIGGSFTSMGSQSRNHLAALDATTGAVTSWDPNADNDVNTLAVIGNTVYTGGTFTSMGGQTRNYLAALDATTGAVTPWNPNANNYVNVLTVSGSTVYAGGWFTSIGGQTRNRLAAFDAAGNLTSWNPSINYNPAGSPDLQSYVLALSVSGNTVYAGGYFMSITTGSTTTTRNYLAAFDATTGAVTTWDPNTNSAVNTLSISGGAVYTGGSFTSIGGQTRNYIASIDAVSGTVTSWDPNANSAVNALAISGGTVYAGGNFTSIGGQTRIRLAALDAEGNLLSWNPSIYNPADPVGNSSINALAVGGNTVYAGGYFTSITSGSTTTTRNYLAAFDATTGAVTSWNPNANFYVNALTISGGVVYVAGSFSSIGGQTRNSLAALDVTTGSVTPWNPNVDIGVLAFVVSGNTVYAGGYTFSSLPGPSVQLAALVAFDATTGAVTSWNPNPQGSYPPGSRYNSRVSALAFNGNTIYAGGSFTSMGFQSRNYLAAIDATTGAVASWNPDANRPVNALSISDSVVYAGGDFTSMGGQTRNHLAALDATTGAVTSWNPNADNSVNALAIGNSAVLAGGSFTSVGMDPLSYFALISK